MNNCHLKLLLRVLLLVSFASSIVACNEKTNTPEDRLGEKTVIRLSLPEVEMRGGALFTGDQEINKVRIFVFKSNGVLDTQKLFTAGSDDFTNPFSLTAHEGQRTIYVVANEDDDLTGKLSGIVFENHLKQVITQEIEASLTMPFVMTGSNTVTLSSTQTIQATVPLKRLAAKVTLSFKQETPADDEVKITKVTIDRLAKKSSLLPSNTFSLGTPWEYVLNTEQQLTNNAPYVSYIADNTLFVYENIGTSADSLNRAPRLLVEAMYNGILTRYRAYINDETAQTDTQHPYSLRRNHRYDLKATITGLGEFSSLLLKTEVLPWDLTQLEKNFLEPKVLHIVPDPFIGDNFTSQASPLIFDVKIKASEGTTWKATLTNGLEFALVNGAGFVEMGNADGETVYRIKIVPLKPAGDSPRKTDLYFTVEGKHVLIKVGSGGERLTRIPITQKSAF